MAERPNNSVYVLTKPGQLDKKPATYPACGAEDIVIRVNYVGICGSDLHAFRFGPYIKPVNPDQEIQLGHECSGTIVEIGAAVENFKVGDHVVIEPGVPCGKCIFCKTGRYNLCYKMDFMATSPNYRGALTEYLAYPAHMAYKIPEGLSLKTAALIEPAAVGFHAVKMSNAGLGDTVLILGSGTIGLMTLIACKLKGIKNVIMTDISAVKLNLALQLGASRVVNSSETDLIEELTKSGTVIDIIFETAGSSQTAKLANMIVNRGGKIMIVGTIPDEVPINFLKINREVLIMTVFRYANDFNDVIQALSGDDAIPLERLISKTYDYEKTQAGFEQLVEERMTLVKGVVEISGEN